MSRVDMVFWMGLPRFPRVSGDEPSGYSVPPSLWAFSPRERG